jgi:hypothetical protein
MLRYTTAPEEQVVGAGDERRGWITIQVGLMWDERSSQIV